MLRRLYIIAICCLLGSCSAGNRGQPSVIFTHLPPAGDGSAAVVEPIAGKVVGARPGQQIVLFARSGVWWVQPREVEPFTKIEPDQTWKSETHPGNAYAALLVDPGYHPPATINELPVTGNAVHAVAIADSSMLTHPAAKTLHFSGYEWKVRHTANDPGGTRNLYDPANAWTDEDGNLHLAIIRRDNDWTSAEVGLSASLGYGTYSFIVRDISNLDPAAVLSLSTWDDNGPREMLVEISRWGEPDAKNAQYVIQPYYVPANVVRFVVPPGLMRYSFEWNPGRIHFKTARAPKGNSASTLIAEHDFTSGVPSVGTEKIHMNFYVFNNRRNPLRNGAEVVIEKFEYLP